jgi:putative FmdB family regulatory protein
MPIYAYRCATCGHAQDVLQKMSDPVLTVCPACSAATYEKQLTAAGFQLKGSGWYVTDFRGGNTAAPPKEGEAAKPAAGKPADGAGDAAAAKPAESKSAAPAPAPAAAPAAAPAPPSGSSKS